MQVTGFNINFFNASDFVYPAPNNSFVFGQPGKRLPFPDYSFDLVMSMNVLEHVAGAHCRHVARSQPYAMVVAVDAVPHRMAFGTAVHVSADVYLYLRESARVLKFRRLLVPGLAAVVGIGTGPPCAPRQGLSRPLSTSSSVYVNR